MSEHPLQLRAAYGVCRHIARSAAKNFYYGFLVLPARKRNALSAVYAFMRHADDISDDPSMPAGQRREKLDEWINALRRVVAGEPTDDPVLFALADSQKTYNIPIELLEKLVHGTAMDVPRARCSKTRAGAMVSATSIRNLRSALRLLLSRGVGGRADLHSHLWLSRPARRKAGGADWGCFSAYQHHSRRERRRRDGARVPAEGRSWRASESRHRR